MRVKKLLSGERSVAHSEDAGRVHVVMNWSAIR